MSEPDCLTCGFPGLRSAGHAEWCASWEAMSQAERNTAAFERAVKIGLVGLHHGGASAAQMVAAKKRAAAKKRLGLW